MLWQAQTIYVCFRACAAGRFFPKGMLGQGIERSWEARRYFKGSAPSGLPAQQIGICGSARNLQNGAWTVYIESDRLHPITSAEIDSGLLPTKQVIRMQRREARLPILNRVDRQR